MLICMILKCFSALVPQSLYLFHDLLCYLATYRCICLSKTILLTCLPIFLARTYLCTCRHIYLCLYIILSVYFSDLSVEYILEKMDGSCQYNLCFMVHKALKSQFLCFFFCQHSIPSSTKKIINTMRIGFSSGSPMKLNFEKVGVALQQDWMDIDHHWYWLNSNIDGSWWINGSPDQYDQCITGSIYLFIHVFSPSRTIRPSFFAAGSQLQWVTLQCVITTSTIKQRGGLLLENALLFVWYFAEPNC